MNGSRVVKEEGKEDTVGIGGKSVSGTGSERVGYGGAGGLSKFDVGIRGKGGSVKAGIGCQVHGVIVGHFSYGKDRLSREVWKVTGRVSWLVMGGMNWSEERPRAVEDVEGQGYVNGSEVDSEDIGFEAVECGADMSFFAYRAVEANWINEWINTIGTRKFKDSKKPSRDVGVSVVKGISCCGTGDMLKFILDNDG